MVPAERFELPTFGLQNRCTTAVLCRLTKEALLITVWAARINISIAQFDRLFWQKCPRHHMHFHKSK